MNATAPLIDLVVPAEPETRSREPLTWGMAWPRGHLRRSSPVVVVDGEGRRWPTQAKALDRWPDGSIRWLLVDTLCELRGTTTVGLEIEPTAATHSARGVEVVEGSRIVVDTGAARFEVSGGEPLLLASTGSDREKRSAPARCRLRVEDEAGVTLKPRIDRVEVVERGPVRASLALEGRMVTETKSGPLNIYLCLELFAGSATIRAALTLRNPRRARHSGGIWELGDQGSVLLRHASLYLEPGRREGSARLLCSPELDGPFGDYPLPFELYQDSSGGENWRSPSHVNRHGVVPLSFRGYRISGGANGMRANPIVVLDCGDSRLAVAFHHFWEEFPKAVEATANGLRIGMFPRQFGDLHELQGGEQKTHRLYLAFGADTITEEPLGWCRAPIQPVVRPEWTCSTGAVPHLSPREADPNETYLSLVDQAIRGNHSFEKKREAVDQYGWRHFGDIYADHENVYYAGSTPLVSHYNNQYDAVAGLIYQFLRSGEVRWWKLADELANHVVDIDVYHTDLDRPAYNGGLFWHTCHYVDAGRSTHRSYPRSKDSPGGGPSPEHCYTNGLKLHYFLSGNTSSREAVLGLAQWVINLDDGRKTVLRWLSRGHTGLASATGSFDYHGPGRAPANSINALLDAHRLTGRTRLLEEAEQLIRRCIHPADNIDERDLLDAERRWYYTVFLQTLGDYLDYKAELSEHDAMYAYARESLLRYADWMTEHEHPYLQKFEALEYPTETWAAQDMRKSEVLNLAAKYASGERRAAFLERANFFYEYATRTLSESPNRHFTRPVVLMLRYGWSQAYFDLHRQLPSSGQDPVIEDFGLPERFVPQRKRAKRSLVGLLLIVAGMLAVVLYVLGV